jgi:NADH:ubiquinone oxidoreductase subunit F (NADH-binding)
MPALLAHIFTFGAAESCGKCTPCRLGSRRAQGLFQQIASGTHLDTSQKAELVEILGTMKATSLCGHGAGLAEVAFSVIAKFGHEVMG